VLITRTPQKATGDFVMTSRSAGFVKLSTVATVAALAGALATYLPVREAGAENQPHMRAALQSLQNARAQLNQARADKGGHRANAINLVNQAIAEVERGIGFDNRH
jgi:hypothetical protein